LVEREVELESVSGVWEDEEKSARATHLVAISKREHGVGHYGGVDQPRVVLAHQIGRDDAGVGHELDELGQLHIHQHAQERRKALGE
jgi:hypothetical protein